MKQKTTSKVVFCFGGIHHLSYTKYTYLPMWYEIPNDKLLNIGQNYRMNKQIVIIVIATRSIPLADGLDALLKAIPQIEKVETVRTIEQAVQRVEQIKPRVLLLDLSLAGKKPKALLERILLLSPATLRVLLVDDVQDIKWQPQFAEAILVKGVSPSALATILTDLLLPKGIENKQIQSRE